jgi:hypothetical protein
MKEAGYDPDSDLASWKWLGSLIETWGEAGVSSDESDTEMGRPVAVVKRMPWRRECEEYMDFLDQERLDGGLYKRKGQPPMQRVHMVNSPESGRPPPKGLPASVYSPKWVTNLSNANHHLIYAPGKGDFEWRFLKKGTLGGE